MFCEPQIKIKKCNLIIRGERAQRAIKGPPVARAGAPSTISALVTLEEWRNGESSSKYLAGFCKPLTQLETSEKRKPQLRNCLYQIGFGTYLWDIFLMANWCRMVKPSVGSSIPRQMDLGCVRNAESRKGKEANKQHSSVACASVPVSRIQPWALSLASLVDRLLAVRWKNHFPPVATFAHDVYHSNRKANKNSPYVKPILMCSDTTVCSLCHSTLECHYLT